MLRALGLAFFWGISLAPPFGESVGPGFVTFFAEATKAQKTTPGKQRRADHALPDFRWLRFGLHHNKVVPPYWLRAFFMGCDGHRRAATGVLWAPPFGG
jgi:hypothetical protein